MSGLLVGKAALTIAGGGLPVSIATRSGMQKQGAPTVDTTGHTGHHRVEIVADTATAVRARYGFWSWMSVALAAGTVLIDAALVLPSNTLVPLTFNGGLSTLTVVNDGIAKPYYDTDPLTGVTLTRGQTPAIRTFARAASGTADLGVTWYSDTGTFSWYQSGNHLADDPAAPPTLPGPAYANTYYCAPIALLGVQS